MRRDARKSAADWGRRKAEYFSREIWTGVIGLKGRDKLVFRRRGILRVEGVRTELTGDGSVAWLRPTLHLAWLRPTLHLE
jgi:hypothetical protein